MNFTRDNARPCRHAFALADRHSGMLASHARTALVRYRTQSVVGIFTDGGPLLEPCRRQYFKLFTVWPVISATSCSVSRMLGDNRSNRSTTSLSRAFTRSRVGGALFEARVFRADLDLTVATPIRPNLVNAEAVRARLSAIFGAVGDFDWFPATQRAISGASASPGSDAERASTKWVRWQMYANVRVRATVANAN
jgi:hypothetical protein